MKLKRMIASVLALLLMVSLLPIGVMADTVDNNPAGNTVPEITSGNTMEVNAGTVDTNGGTVKCNLGHVETNNKNVNTNSGIVTTNEGKVITNGTKGTVTTNEKDVTYNQGNVETNAENGTVKYNGGKITTNEGTVNKNDTIINSAGVELKGVIETNKGTVIENNKGCTVKTNAEGGTVQTNQGLVETNNNKVTTNSGIVTTNRGTVITNGTKGTVTTNEKDVTYNKGNVVTNAENGTVDKNWGNIATNNGTVNKNETVKNKDGDEFKGVIETNNGTVKTNGEGGTVGKKDKDGNAVPGTGNNGTIETNNGTVISNNEDGTVVTNAKGGEIDINNGSLIVNHEDATVGINNGDIELNYGDIDTNNDYVVWNYGAVETNTIDGTVWNETTQDQNGQNVTGTVTNNYGTMITNTGKVDEDGRSIYKTEYGVQVQNTDGGAGTKLLQAVENTIVKLADLFKRDGYELVGYNDITPEPEYPDEDWDGPVEYALNNNPSAQELSATEFHATRPSILSLIWKAIVKPAAPSGSSGEPEPKTVQNNIPTTLSADQVKVGAYVRQGNLLFRIIEVNDDSIRVVIVGKLSEQALADMLGFLKQHLSDAQIAKINGEPALLEQELVTYFFGGTFEHISFYAAPDLFA